MFLRQINKKKQQHLDESEISNIEDQLKHLFPLLRENNLMKIYENANEEVNYTNEGLRQFASKLENKYIYCIRC